MTESDRRHVTFRQAEGLEAIPGPLAVGELSNEARALIWSVLYQSLDETSERSTRTGYETWVGTDWRAILSTWHVRKMHKPIDEFSPVWTERASDIKNKVIEWELSYLFDFLTYVMRHPSCPYGLAAGLADALDSSRMAYSISEKTIYPIASKEEGETVRSAFADLARSEYNGARSHLADAGQLLAAGDWAGSVRESIHAVESVARVIEPNASTLSDALRKLSAADRLNPNLKRGFEALYNYTSDEKGVRHAKVFEAQSAVTQTDAAYMFGACASFTSYLIAQNLAQAGT